MRLLDGGCDRDWLAFGGARLGANLQRRQEHPRNLMFVVALGELRKWHRASLRAQTRAAISAVGCGDISGLRADCTSALDGGLARALAGVEVGEQPPRVEAHIKGGARGLLPKRWLNPRLGGGGEGGRGVAVGESVALGVESSVQKHGEE